LKTQTIHT